MTSIRDAGTSTTAQAGQPASQFADRSPDGDPLARLFALLPTSGHLEAVAGGTDVANSVSAVPRAGTRAATIDVSRALLSPLESLPPFVALDAVRKCAGAAKTATD